MRALALCLLLTAASCQQATGPARFPVHVKATSDQGEPLAGVKVAADGRDLGTTDATGLLRASLPGAEGQRVQLGFVCPDRYERSGDEPSLMLRNFSSVDPDAPQHTTVQVQCSASLRSTVVAVRAGQPNLPVLLRGEVVARTNERGTTHVLLQERAGTSVRLTLDTSSAPQLRPASPVRMFAVTAKDDFTVWDQPFEVIAKKHKRKPKPEVAPEPEAHVPERLD
jgi:hypothetical protein